MNNKKYFGLLLIAFLVLLTINLVSAQSFVDKLKSGFETGDFSEVVAKYLFWGIVCFITYGILGLVPIINEIGVDPTTKKGTAKSLFTKLVLALIISFLSTAYLKPYEI